MTSSTAVRLSAARPYFAISQPSPPPRVRPAMPVVEIAPPVTASPCAAVSRFSSRQSTPPCARTVRAPGSTWIPFIGERSIISAPSTTARPATLWPPPRTQISRPCRAREPDRVRDVRGVLAARDQRRPPVDQPVVDAARLLVAVVARLQDAAGKRGPQLLEPLQRRCLPSLPFRSPSPSRCARV